MDQQVCLVETPYGGFPPQDVGFYWTNFLVHTVFGRGSHNNTKRSKPNFKTPTIFVITHPVVWKLTKLDTGKNWKG